MNLHHQMTHLLQWENQQPVFGQPTKVGVSTIIQSMRIMMKKMQKFKVFFKNKISLKFSQKLFSITGLRYTKFLNNQDLKIEIFRNDVTCWRQKVFTWLSSENDFGFIISVYVMTILFILSDRASPMLHAGKRRLQK